MYNWNQFKNAQGWRYCNSYKTSWQACRQESHWCTHQHILSAKNSLRWCLNQCTTASTLSSSVNVCSLSLPSSSSFSCELLTQSTVLLYTCACQCVYWVKHTATPPTLQQQCCEWVSVVFASHVNMQPNCSSSTCIPLSTRIIPLPATAITFLTSSAPSFIFCFKKYSPPFLRKNHCFN